MTAEGTMIVDSHHHFWDLDAFDYGWMSGAPGILRRNYMPADLEPELKHSGVSRTVVVQANQDPGEADFLLDLADANGFVAGVVAWVDLTATGLGATLDRLTRRDKLVGVRHLVHDEPDEAWLAREDVVVGLKELARRGLTYDLLLRPQHLKYIPALADRVPELRMVVDHIAKPLMAQGVMEPWAADIAAVAEVTGIYCKVSGLVTEADHAGWTIDDLRPYVAHVVKQFGPDRLMWGSDWPVCRLAAGYDRVLSATLEAVGPMTEGDRRKLLGGNATEFYALG
jgi:L-fuconolactonase